MAEIRRNPILEIRGGKEFVTFDQDHTLSDFIRYLLHGNDREELIYLAKSVDAKADILNKF